LPIDRNGTPVTEAIVINLYERKYGRRNGRETEKTTSKKKGNEIYIIAVVVLGIGRRRLLCV